MRLHLWGMGTALPPFGIDQAEAAEISRPFHCLSEDQERLLPVLYRRAGVKRRYSVVLEADAGPLETRQSFFPAPQSVNDHGPTTAARMERFDQESGAIAAAAARNALADAGVGPETVTHLITVTCSGFAAPGFDVSLIRNLPLGPDTSRTQVGFMGCHGALNALRVARAFAAEDPDACILICCVELCTLHHHYGWDPDQIVAGALFADGAAAVVCRGRPREAPGGWRIDDNGATIVADTTDAMGWRIRDHGFEMNLSPRVPELIHQHLRPWLERWLGRNGLRLDQIESWAIHPGGPRILSACGEALGLKPERLQDSVEILQQFGNMSSPTILFILDRLRRRNATGPGVMLGFGPGLAIEAALLRR